MQQVLFHIPIRTSWFPDGIPIYGYGMMLFLAFIICTWIAGRRAEKEGIPRERIQDLAIWLFLFGIVGARITYVGAIGYVFAYYVVIRKHKLSFWKLADIVSPCVALGICLGRLGCFLNGCCYGNVACPECQFQAHFPLSAPPRIDLVNRGYQTVAGFTLAETAPDLRTVEAVDPASPASASGLQAGDIITAINGKPTESVIDLEREFHDWPRGENSLTLTVKREGKSLDLGPFVPRTIGLHPTQVYSSIGGFLIFCLLSAYAPFKRHDGELFVLLLLAYAPVRFLEESLRNDTPLYTFISWWPTLTLSQNVSIGIFVSGLLLGIYIWTRPTIRSAAPA